MSRLVQVPAQRRPRHAKIHIQLDLKKKECRRIINRDQVQVKGRGPQHAQSIPNANPVHIAALYALSCASIGALSPFRSTETPKWRDWALRTLLKTIVDTLRPIADPIFVIAWNRAPATLCSCGSDILEMNSVPDTYVNSVPRTIKHAEGKPKAQYVALGSITAKNMFAHPVISVPMAAKKAAESDRQQSS